MERDLKRYELLKLLGEGGSGRVYLARDTHLGRYVALKRVARAAAQFQIEVYLLQKAALFMLPVIYDAWVEEDHSGVIVMEYVKGRNLREYLSLQRGVSERQIYEWGVQLGVFLQKLHTGDLKILYRDLKPENIMVQPDKRLRLIDVGAAACAEQENGQKRIRVGSFGYASPEQWEGKAVDERTDIYALGAVLRDIMAACQDGTKSDSTARQSEAERAFAGGMMAACKDALGEKTGKHGGAWKKFLYAFSGKIRKGDKVPAGMVYIAERCRKKDREKRYATAEAFLSDWKRYRWFGRRLVFLSAGLQAGCLFSLAGAACILRRGKVSDAVPWLLSYLGFKMLRCVFERKSARWEQKKSVWCRSGGEEW